MNKQELKKLIEKGVQDAVIEKLKSLNQQRSNSVEYKSDSEEITEDDVDSFLFFGGDKPKAEKADKQFTIRENMENNIKITTSEIKNFEQSFREVLDAIPGSTIVFDKQKNGYSILALKKPDGIEVVCSGVINMGSRGKMNWMYSIMNGLTINAQNMKVSSSNKTAIESLFNHYDSWQKEWREKLNYPQIAQGNAT